MISFERDVVDDQFNHESREINSANARLLSDYEHIQRTNTRLDRTQRLAAEAEQIGANVLSDLRRQREQIERASQTLHETDIDIDRSNRMLRKMVRKVYANRIISIIILISLTACVMLVIWVKFIPN